MKLILLSKKEQDDLSRILLDSALETIKKMKKSKTRIEEKTYKEHLDKICQMKIKVGVIKDGS